MKKLLLQVLIDLLLAVGIYYAYVEEVSGAYNVVALWVWVMFILSAIFLLGSCEDEAKKLEVVKFRKTKTTLSVVTTIAESAAFAWFGSFTLASINLVSLLFVQAGKINLDDKPKEDNEI